MAQQTRVPVLREITKDRQGDKIQQNAALAARAMNAIGIVPGNLVTDQLFAFGVNTYVKHGLGRVPKGYILCNVRPHPTIAPTGAAGCQRNTTSDPQNNEKLMLSLGPFVPFMADVWVY